MAMLHNDRNISAIMISQFIKRQNDSEIVFHTPFLLRLCVLPFVIIFGYCLYLWITSFSHVTSKRDDWFLFTTVTAILAYMTSLFFWMMLPHELYLDFARHTYRTSIGVAPLIFVRAGPFDELKAVFVAQVRGGNNYQYRVGIAWHYAYRLRFFFGDGRYRFLTTDNKKTAEEYGQDIALRMNIQFAGLFSIGTPLP